MLKVSIIALFVHLANASNYSSVKPSLRCYSPFGYVDEPSERGFNAMEEIKWEPINDYAGYYEISNSGSVRSLTRTIERKNGGRVLLIGVTLVPNLVAKREGQTGYKSVTLSRDNEKDKWMIHQLVGIHFVPNPHNLPILNHKDGNKLNNWDWNLEWTTYSANNQHAFDTGLKVGKRGKDNPIYTTGVGCKGITERPCLWCNRMYLPQLERGIYCSRSCKSLHQHHGK